MESYATTDTTDRCLSLVWRRERLGRRETEVVQQSGRGTSDHKNVARDRFVFGEHSHNLLKKKALSFVAAPGLESGTR